MRIRRWRRSTARASRSSPVATAAPSSTERRLLAVILNPMERLFDTGEAPRARTDVPPAEAPLAVRMRPRSLDELVGQGELLAGGSAVRGATGGGGPHSALVS